MGAPSKRAKKIRPASDFDLVRLAAEIRAPKVASGYYAWDLDRIRAARDAQMIGRFQQAARLAEATRTDYAIFSAFTNRLAPQRGLPIKIEPAGDSARAKRIADEAGALFGPNGVGIHPDTLADIDGALVNHGVAFGVNVVTPRLDGSRVDVELKSWPIEHVWWDTYAQSFCTQTENGREYICHGDGRWSVFQQHEKEPWKYGVLLAAAILWADHAFGVRDRARAGNSHGNAKVIGELPIGVALQDKDGALTQEAQAFLALLQAIAGADSPYGIRPAGSKTEYLTNASKAWEIFKEIIDSGDKAADWIYLGRDVNMQAAGGDAVQYLFGVRNDLVEGSLRAIERGVKTGTIDPWCAMNFGDSSLAPSRVYLMPDADEDARRKSLGERTKAFYEAIAAAKLNGFVIDQPYVDALAKDYGITPPKLTVSTPTQPGAATPPGQTTPATPTAPASGSPPSLRAVP